MHIIYGLISQAYESQPNFSVIVGEWHQYEGVWKNYNFVFSQDDFHANSELAFPISPKRDYHTLKDESESKAANVGSPHAPCGCCGCQRVLKLIKSYYTIYICSSASAGAPRHKLSPLKNICLFPMTHPQRQHTQNSVHIYFPLLPN